ncbi:hypothetical protein IGI04_015491, partial [Brassica rapa subsp. trilocularis]
NSEETQNLGFLGISSEYTDEIPRKSYFLGIFRGNTEEIIFPRNIPMKYRGNHIFSEFLLIYIVPRNFLGIFRGNSEEHMFGPRNIPRKFRGKTSVPRNIPRLFRGSRALLLGFLFLRKSLGIFRGNSEEHLFFLGISSEYSEAFPRKAKKFDVLKPQTCVPRNFLGIFRGNSEEKYKLIEIPKNMISSVFHRYIPRKYDFLAAKYFAKIEIENTEEIPTDSFRRTLGFIDTKHFFFPNFSVLPPAISLFFRRFPPSLATISPANPLYSYTNHEVYPSGYSDDIFLGIFRGLSDELVVLGISSEIHFLGISSEISEGFPRKNEFPRSYFRGLFSSVCRRNSVIPTTYRRFFP